MQPLTNSSYFPYQNLPDMNSVFKKIVFLFLIVCAVTGFNACHKNPDLAPTPTVPVGPPDLTTKINASVSGFVTDENDLPLAGAMVKFGSGNATTDNTGYFKIQNAEVVKSAAVVTVTKYGYFKGVKTYSVTEGRAAIFRIKLIQRTEAGTVNAASGGNVALPNGLMISLPSAPVVVAATGTEYGGTVHVSASWLNPEAQDLGMIMPGDLRGIDESGNQQGLKTYGMAAVELLGDAGELLQMASGKKATLTIPLSTNVAAIAPSSIPLWYFDEEKGLWKEEGSATKTGNNYVGEVSHFSYWNCDLPCAIIPLTFTVVDQNGNGQGGVQVVITPHITDPCTRVFGTTDSTGYVSVFVTPNTQFDLFLYESCSSGMVNIQTFTSGYSPIDLGNVAAAGTVSSLANITGTLTNCSGNPVTNGVVRISSTFYPVDNTGHFNVPLLLGCNNSDLYFTPFDYGAMQSGTPRWHHLSPGVNNIGNMQACGTNINQYVHCVIDGVIYNYQSPADTIGHHHVSNSSSVWVSLGTGILHFEFDRTGIAVGSTQPSDDFSWPPFDIGGLSVLITESGSVPGEYISGFLSGTAADYHGISHTVTADFRVAY